MRKQAKKDLDELLEANIIHLIAAEEVKCCSPVSIAQKAHAHEGLTLNELIHRLEEQCTAAGRPPSENLPPRDKLSERINDDALKTLKYCFLVNCSELNKSTL